MEKMTALAGEMKKMTALAADWNYSVMNNEWVRKEFEDGYLTDIEVFRNDPWKPKPVKHRNPICRTCGVRHKLTQTECDDSYYTAKNGVCPVCHIELPLSGECC